MNRIVLASASPRRRMLLEWAEIAFDVIPSDATEEWPAGMNPMEIPEYLAQRKASTVQNLDAYKRYTVGTPILAADTIVLLDGQVIGKPVDRTDAIGILHTLSGRTHQVVTGVCLTDGRRTVSFSDLTEVGFHELTDSDIQFYVDKYQPFDKAGAYAIQEWIGVVGISSIRGDFYNVMGLPVNRVIRALRNEFI